MTNNNNSPSRIGVSEGTLLALLAMVNFTHIMDLVIMMPMNPIFQRELGIDETKFGWLVASYAGSAGVTGIIGSFVLDKFDRRKTLIFLYAGFLLATLGCALSGSYWLLFIARSFAGAFGGMLGALVLAVIGDVIPMERRGRAMGIVMSAFSVASVIGIPVGLYFADAMGWPAPFWLVSGLSLIVFIALLLKFPSITVHMENKKSSSIERFKAIFQLVNARWALVFNFVLMLAGMSVVPFIASYMVKNVGLQTTQLMYIYMCGGLVTVVSGPMIGKAADRIGKQKMFLIMGLFSIIPIVLITNLPALPLWQVLCCTSFFFIVFGGRFVPAMSMITSSVPVQVRGSFMSFNSAVQQVATAVAAGTAGAMLQKNELGAITNFWVVGVFAVIATLVCIIISYKVKPIS